VRALLIEDDAKTARALASGLQGEGFEPVTAKTGEEGFFLVSRESFDVVILDWMLPGRDGIEVLRTLRAGGSKTPVLLLTARDAVEDRVLGLNAGADDYLVKPFAFAELLARVRALLRRVDSGSALRQQIGDLTLNMQTRRVARGSREIALTPREFDLLMFLAQYHDQTVTRQMIAREVWREPNRATPLDNVIDVHLAHSPPTLDDGDIAALILSVRGVGFVFRVEADVEAFSAAEWVGGFPAADRRDFPATTIAAIAAANAPSAKMPRRRNSCKSYRTRRPAGSIRARTAN